MKKKIYILASVIGILLLLYLNFQYGNYYSSPLESIKKYNSSNGRFKEQIETFSIDNKPLMFYISQKDEVCMAHYKMRKFGDEVKYKVSKVTIYEKYIEDVVFEKTYNTSETWIDTQKTSVERILFGVLTPLKATDIQINGKKPIVEHFKLGEREYVLWYVTGGVELDNINPSILE
jgi:hypothetical protein